MPKIKKIKAREIIDSRGNPTVECDIYLSDEIFGRAAVPSGASTGMHEAIELRDQDKNRYGGKGVLKALSNITEIISPKILNKEFKNIKDFDEFLISTDGTKNKSNLGANATLALSLAFAKSLASYDKKGNKDGVWKSWDENGTLRVVTKYKNGMRVGTWKTWNENGVLTGEKSYSSSDFNLY